MSKEVLQKLAEHDKRFDEHDKRFIAIDKRFDEHDKRFDSIENRLENMAVMLINHDGRLDRIEYELKNNVATKTDISNIMTMLDKLVGFARKKDQELVFMGARVSRIEKLVCG